jgi:hypothetical protein
MLRTYSDIPRSVHLSTVMMHTCHKCYNFDGHSMTSTILFTNYPINTSSLIHLLLANAHNHHRFRENFYRSGIKHNMHSKVWLMPPLLVVLEYDGA